VASILDFKLVRSNLFVYSVVIKSTQMKKLFLSIVFLMLTNYIFAQTSYGLKAGVGPSSIVRTKVEYNLKEVELDIAPISGHIGLYYRAPIKNDFYCEAELLINQIETIYNNESDEGLGDSEPILLTTKGYRHFTYITIPILIGIQTEKVDFNIGISTSLNIRARARVISEIDSDSQELVLGWENSDKKINLKVPNLDFGPRLGAEINTSYQLTIFANFYHGITKLYNYEDRNFYSHERIIQLTLGIKYRLSQL